MRKVLAGAIALALVATTALATYTVTHVPTTAPTPDWTVAPCSIWADTVDIPTLPAYTYTDRCMDTDGTVLYAQ